MKTKTRMIILLGFSMWLMWHTFGYDYRSKSLLVSAKAYSDFGSLIPLIRYFPTGLNFPIQHPLFPGEPMRYHFLFYALIGTFEKIGIPLDWALNIPSGLGFFSLLFLIFYGGREIFKNTKAGWIAIILFLFNSSFSWIDFFKNYSLFDLPRLASFPSFRPWNDSLVTAFWNLNIYTNQRHLGFSLAVCVLITLILYVIKNRYLFWVGFLWGSLLLLNQAGFLIVSPIVVLAFIFRTEIRKILVWSMLGYLPWFILYKLIFPIPQLPVWNPGWLADKPLIVSNWLKFWLFNYGIGAFLIWPGLFLIPKKLRGLVMALFLLFMVGNMWQFSPDLINNHKIFNFVFIWGSIIIANLITRFPKFIFYPILILLIMGGIVDLFPVINDHFIVIADRGNSADVDYFASLPNSAVVLNSTWFYHPASLAGRAIYNGYSYFTWSYGYEQETREQKTLALYGATSTQQFCQLLSLTPITNIEVSTRPESFIKINYNLIRQWQPEYQNNSSGIKVYSRKQICTNV